ncbi:RNA polymerase sigma factor [Streptomyces sp. NPDC001381]|uniref:RNA polymerase sigma factor n=1 Tax=Streptomyces sp. NPDC001381 TaxID=3364567 RepID=UPI0036CE7A45
MSTHTGRPEGDDTARGGEETSFPPPEAVRAYSDFVRGHQRRAVRLGSAYGLSTGEAEEVAQAALVVVWVRWPQLMHWEPGRQAGYLNGILRNLVVAHGRGEERRRKLMERLARTDPDLVVADGEIVATSRADIPHQAAEDAQTEQELEHLLNHPQLNSNYRDSLLGVDAGQSTRERAQAKGITGGAERVATHRARRRIQQIMKHEGGENQ